MIDGPLFSGALYEGIFSLYLFCDYFIMSLSTDLLTFHVNSFHLLISIALYSEDIFIIFVLWLFYYRQIYWHFNYWIYYWQNCEARLYKRVSFAECMHKRVIFLFSGNLYISRYLLLCMHLLQMECMQINPQNWLNSPLFDWPTFHCLFSYLQIIFIIDRFDIKKLEAFLVHWCDMCTRTVIWRKTLQFPG